MSALGRLHDKYVFQRRVERLVAHLAPELPANARLLDVGCGDGSIAKGLTATRPDVDVVGVDVLVREDTQIPVSEYDGATLPFPDAAFDAVSLVDVLHHTDEPFMLLREAARVAPVVIVKDHLTDGVLARPTLRLMDWFGNAPHGVRLPYNYLSEDQWRSGSAGLELEITSWNTDLGIYAPPLSWWFDRRLHVVFSLRPSA